MKQQRGRRGGWLAGRLDGRGKGRLELEPIAGNLRSRFEAPAGSVHSFAGRSAQCAVRFWWQLKASRLPSALLSRCRFQALGNLMCHQLVGGCARRCAWRCARAHRRGRTRVCAPTFTSQDHVRSQHRHPQASVIASRRPQYYISGEDSLLGPRPGGGAENSSSRLWVPAGRQPPLATSPQGRRSGASGPFGAGSERRGSCDHRSTSPHA